MPYKKKLIEVALPLDAVNKASAREKSIRHGHPSTLHLWWARRPLAAARAVIFAQMVDDPSAHPDLFPTEKDQEKERQRLFRIIEDLVKWENTTNEDVLQQARDEIWQSWRYTCAENADHPQAKELFDRHKLPAFHDPFAGGGALPLEAQRLGLEAHASDLNPVAVLINKAMIEIPPKFAGKPPVNPEAQQQKDLIEREWRGAQGLAEDVRFYGQWMRDEAEKRIGHLYPKVEITEKMVKDRPDLKPYLGRKLTVIAWLWARTVKSPNPAFAQVDVPLVSNFMLSTKAGKEAYVEPVIETGDYRFKVKMGKPKDIKTAKRGTKLVRATFSCLMSGTPISGDYIKAEGKGKQMGARLMAIVAKGERGRVYLSPEREHEVLAREVEPMWKPEGDVPARLTGGTCVPYGLEKWGDLFTPRQLVALTTFSDLVQEAREQVKLDAVAAGLVDDGKGLADGGSGAQAYADAVAVYLAFTLSKQTDLGNSLCRWEPVAQCPRQLFGRQAIPMCWDFAEGNPLGDSSGAWVIFINGITKAFAKTYEYVSPNAIGYANQTDAGHQQASIAKVVSTDPPYYDNIGYADLSDFFYVWLRRSLKIVMPDLFTTMAVPKTEELVATPYRHGGKEKAEDFFLTGMTRAMERLANQSHPAFPVTIYYAFKQTKNSQAEGIANTGWETFLDAVIKSGFSVTGTWPMRTENSSRMVGQGTNALASSIVLVCRRRSFNAQDATFREFASVLREELPKSFDYLRHSNIAPVDLAQAAIGPGMAIYTRYAKVLDANGQPLSVGKALALINQILDETLAQQEGNFDADSRWCLAWFEQFGFAMGDFGTAEVLSKAKNTNLEALARDGFMVSKAGKVRLLRPEELSEDWDPVIDTRLTAWEMVHHLIRVLDAGGERTAAKMAAKLGSKAETARELCYRLYTLCERKKRAAEAMAYNSLVQSWPEISRLAREEFKPQESQPGLYDGNGGE